MAEDQHKFPLVLDKVGVGQPKWTEVMSVEASKAFANRVGYVYVSFTPVSILHSRYLVLIPPSNVLSGAMMNVVFEEPALEFNLSATASASPLHPVVVTLYTQRIRM